MSHWSVVEVINEYSLCEQQNTRYGKGRKSVRSQCPLLEDYIKHVHL